jgi:hypothetical protein
MVQTQESQTIDYGPFSKGNKTFMFMNSFPD